MPEDDPREFGRFGLQVEILEIVEDIDRRLANFEHVGERKLLRPLAMINISTHCGNWRNFRECIEDSPGRQRLRHE